MPLHEVSGPKSLQFGGVSTGKKEPVSAADAVYYTGREKAVHSRAMGGSGCKSVLAATRLETVAVTAIAHVELVAHHGEQHRMGAVQQLPIFDGLKRQFGRDVWRAAAVPANPMSRFWLRSRRRVHGL